MIEMNDNPETVILVDDLPITFRGGGEGTPIRMTRFKFFFEKICKKYDSINNVFLILGDGTFKFNVEENEIVKDKDDNFSLTCSTDANSIVSKIREKAANKCTLLLIDYRLSINDPLKGIELAEGVLMGLQNDTNIYKILYSGLGIEQDAADNLKNGDPTFLEAFGFINMDCPGLVSDIMFG